MAWQIDVEQFFAADRTGRASSSPQTANSSGIAPSRKARFGAAMSTKSRQAIYGGRIIGAKIRAQGAREAAQKAVRDAVQSIRHQTIVASQDALDEECRTGGRVGISIARGWAHDRYHLFRRNAGSVLARNRPASNFATQNEF